MINKGESREGRIGNLGLTDTQLLDIKQINSEDLLYSTGNYIQYLVITYNGKEPEKNIYVCVCVYIYMCIYIYICVCVCVCIYN